MKSRNEIYGGDFTAEASDVKNNNINGTLKSLVITSSTDVTKNRSSWIRTMLYSILDSFVHKTENRATKDNVGTSIDPTDSVYVTPQQLPEVYKTTNDFVSVPANSGVLSASQNVLDFTIDSFGKNKIYILKLHNDLVAWLKARTYTLTELVSIITNTVTSIISNPETGQGLIPVGVIWRYSSITAPDGFLLLNGTTIGNASSGAIDANNKYKNLFIHIWSNYANTQCAVPGGRGTSALSDWLANKQITLPDYRGKVSGTYKSVMPIDTNFGTLGNSFGAEIIPVSALPVVSPYNVTASNITWNMYKENVVEGPGQDVLAIDNGAPAQSYTIPAPTITVEQNTGGGQKHFQPTIIDTAIIKY